MRVFFNLLLICSIFSGLEAYSQVQDFELGSSQIDFENSDLEIWGDLVHDKVFLGQSIKSEDFVNQTGSQWLKNGLGLQFIQYGSSYSLTTTSMRGFRSPDIMVQLEGLTLNNPYDGEATFHRRSTSPFESVSARFSNQAVNRGSQASGGSLMYSVKGKEGDHIEFGVGRYQTFDTKLSSQNCKDSFCSIVKIGGQQTSGYSVLKGSEKDGGRNFFGEILLEKYFGKRDKAKFFVFGSSMLAEIDNWDNPAMPPLGDALEEQRDSQWGALLAREKQFGSFGSVKAQASYLSYDREYKTETDIYSKSNSERYEIRLSHDTKLAQLGSLSKLKFTEALEGAMETLDYEGESLWSGYSEFDVDAYDLFKFAGSARLSLETKSYENKLNEISIGARYERFVGDFVDHLEKKGTLNLEVQANRNLTERSQAGIKWSLGSQAPTLSDHQYAALGTSLNFKRASEISSYINLTDNEYFLFKVEPFMRWVTEDIKGNLQFETVNTGATHYKGVDLVIRAEPGVNTTLSSRLSFVDSKKKSDLANLARETMQISVVQKNIANKLKLQGSWSWTGDRYAWSGEKLKSFNQFDLGAEVRLAKGLRAQVLVENALNSKAQYVPGYIRPAVNYSFKVLASL